MLNLYSTEALGKTFIFEPRFICVLFRAPFKIFKYSENQTLKMVKYAFLFGIKIFDNDKNNINKQLIQSQRHLSE